MKRYGPYGFGVASMFFITVLVVWATKELAGTANAQQQRYTAIAEEMSSAAEAIRVVGAQNERMAGVHESTANALKATSASLDKVSERLERMTERLMMGPGK